MVHKRYIKRNGKTFGPYYYESYRDKNGVVRKKYVGTSAPKKRGVTTKTLLQTLLFLGLFVLLFSIGNAGLDVAFNDGAGVTLLVEQLSITGFSVDSSSSGGGESSGSSSSSSSSSGSSGGGESSGSSSSSSSSSSSGSSASSSSASSASSSSSTKSSSSDSSSSSSSSGGESSDSGSSGGGESSSDSGSDDSSSSSGESSDSSSESSSESSSDTSDDSSSDSTSESNDQGEDDSSSQNDGSDQSESDDSQSEGDESSGDGSSTDEEGSDTDSNNGEGDSGSSEDSEQDSEDDSSGTQTEGDSEDSDGSGDSGDSSDTDGDNTSEDEQDSDGEEDSGSGSSGGSSGTEGEGSGDTNSTAETVPEVNETDGESGATPEENKTKTSEVTGNETDTINKTDNETDETESLVPGFNETALVNDTLLNGTELLNETQVLNETVLVNETKVLNATEAGNISRLQYKAVIGRPVKWIAVVNTSELDLTLDEVNETSLDTLISLPKEATNISVLTGDEVTEAIEEIEAYEEVVENTAPEEISLGVSITGNVARDVTSAKNIFERVWDFFRSFTITGNVVLEDDLALEEKIIEDEEAIFVNVTEEVLEEESEVVAVEYYTDAPQVVESQEDDERIVVVSADHSLNYTDILAYTVLDESMNVTRKDSVVIEWFVDQHILAQDTEVVPRRVSSFEVHDLDSNGIFDYVEWVVPHLSNQSYKIYIKITKAEHRDENLTFVKDIFPEVSELDNVTYTVPENEYVRVTFEKNLTSKNDITLYASYDSNNSNVTNGSAKVEVYEVNDSVVLATFENISEFNEYKIYLTQMNGTQDTFDLKVVGGNVSFDLIIDPTTANVSFETKTDFHGIHVARDLIYVNATTSLGSFDNITIEFFDKNNVSINVSNSSSSPFAISLNDLDPGIYRFNASLFVSGSLNSTTETREIVVSESKYFTNGTIASNVTLVNGSHGLAVDGLDASDDFGSAVAGIGDLDGDGVQDIVVGAQEDENGNSGEGAIYVLFLNMNGSVKSSVKISDGLAGFSPSGLDASDAFGTSVENIGDLDGDGVTDIAVGAPEDENLESGEGAIYILFMHKNGSVKDHTKIADGLQGLNTPEAQLASFDYFGASITEIGDLNGDDVIDLVVGASADENDSCGFCMSQDYGTLYVLFMQSNGSVNSSKRISDQQNGFTLSMPNFNDNFGSAIENIGDLDNDGVNDLAVGAWGRQAQEGTIFILFMDANGSVKSHLEIKDGDFGFNPVGLISGDYFGISIANLGDVSGDGVQDIAVGADFDENSESGEGAYYVLYLNTTGGVSGNAKVTDGLNSTGLDVGSNDRFGSSISNIGDLNGDGVIDLAVGAEDEDGDVSNAGGVLILFSEAPAAPNVDLNAPANNTAPGTNNITFNWTAIDPVDTSLTCNLTINGVVNQTNIASANNTLTSVTVNPLYGTTYWNVTCINDNGVTNTSQTWVMTLGDPPFESKDIDFTTNTPFYGEVIPFNSFNVNVTSDASGIGNLSTSYFNNSVLQVTNNSSTSPHYTTFSNLQPGFYEFNATFFDTGNDIDNQTATRKILIAQSNQSVGGYVINQSLIANGSGGFLSELLGTGDWFGSSVTNLGDLDGDGVQDLAVGASQDETSGSDDEGAVHILFMYQNRTVKDSRKISEGLLGFNPTNLTGSEYFGTSVANLGDLNGDGVQDIAVGAWGDESDVGGDDGEGALYILFLNTSGGVSSSTKISDGQGGFSPSDLINFDRFGTSVANLGDLNGDGVQDIAVGARGDEGDSGAEGALYILFMYSNGTVKNHTKISDTLQGFNPSNLDSSDHFGSSVANLGDLNGDGVQDLAVGASGDENSESGEGALYILFMQSNGSVLTHEKISDGLAGFSPSFLGLNDSFGSSVANLGDLDGDGVVDLGVGAVRDENSESDEGAVYILFLNTSGGVKDNLKISAGSAGFNPLVSELNDSFGSSVANLGDLDGDGVIDLAVGARNANGTAGDDGALYILSLGNDESLQYVTDTPFHGGVIHSSSLVVNITAGSSNIANISTTYFDAAGTLQSTNNSSSSPHRTIFTGLQPGFYEFNASLFVTSSPAPVNTTSTRKILIAQSNQSSQGYVVSTVKVADGLSGFSPENLVSNDNLGWELENIGDLNGDGIQDIAVGAVQDEPGTGSGDDGAIYILFMYQNGTVNSSVKITDGEGGFSPSSLGSDENFGSGIANLGDLDGDGIQDLAVGANADENDSGGDVGEGAVYILFMHQNGTVRSHTKISDGEGGFNPFALNASDQFGYRVASLGDFDGDGIQDLAVSAENDENDVTSDGAHDGAVYILFMHQNGTVKNHTKIADGQNGFSPSGLDNSDGFGTGLENIGDLNGDGVIDLAVGAEVDENGDASEGAIYILFMQSNGSVSSNVKISDGLAGFTPASLEAGDRFGISIANLGDLNGDGVIDLGVGAWGDEYLTAGGAFYILFMNTTGGVKSHTKVSDGLAGFTPTGWDAGDDFGYGIANLGDLDGNGIIDLGVGAYEDDNGNADEGTFYILFLGNIVPHEVTLNSPANDTVQYENVTFNWTVVDASSSYLLCNVTADGVVVAQEVNSTNATWTNATGSFTTSGIKDWNVTCINNYGGVNTSETRKINVFTTSPNVTLNAPANNSSPATNNVTFNWTVTDPLDSSMLCNLTINGVINQTNIASANNTLTSVTVNPLYGINYWNVTCINDNSFSKTSETWVMTLSNTPVVDFGISTAFQGEVIPFNTFDVNVTTTFTDLGNLSTSYFNNSVLQVTNNSSTSPHYTTFSNLKPGFYEFNVTLFDSSNNIDNLTVTRKILIAQSNQSSEGYVISSTKIGDGLGGFSPENLVSNDHLGWELENIGDLNGDGVQDIAVGAPDDEPGTGTGADGAIYVLFMYSNGTVNSSVKITDGEGGFTPSALNSDDGFGSGIANLGDFDGDGIQDLAVGAHVDENASGGDSAEGAVYILFMHQNGTVKNHTKISDGEGGFNPLGLNGSDQFGSRVESLGDLDGDGIQDLAVSAEFDENDVSADGSHEGALYILFMHQNGTVKNHTKITDGQNGFSPSGLDGLDAFGSAIANLGDLNGDGVTDIAVGAHEDENGDTTEGAIYILFMQSNGSVSSNVKISDGLAGFTPESLEASDRFGISIANLGDLNGDGVIDLGVGAWADEYLTAGGAFYILFMNTTGGVKSHTKVSDGLAGFTPTGWDAGDDFGYGIANLGDLDGNGIIDLGVGAYEDDNGNADEGTFYILFLGNIVPHEVTLNGPANDTFQSENVTFNWTVSDASSNYLLCNVTANGAVVAQEVNSTNATWTNTTVTFPSNGLKYWNVTCINDFGGVNTSETREITVTGAPLVNLNAPTNNTSPSGNNITFNWTAIDAVDSSMLCNLTINGVLNQTNIVSANNTLTSVSVNPLYGTNYWNVTCVNDQGSTNTSQTWVVTLSNPPILTFGRHTPFDGDVVSLSSLNVNVTTAFGDIGNLSTSYFNNSVLQATNNSSSSPHFTTFSNLQPGFYEFNVTLFDSSNGIENQTATRKILIAQSNQTANSVTGNTKISDNLGGFNVTLAGNDHFGSSVANLGDLNGDGIQDLAVGAYRDTNDRGAVYILFMHANGTVNSSSKIGYTNISSSSIVADDSFGFSVANLGDLDGDGIIDLAIGAEGDNNNSGGDSDEGAVFIVFMHANGSVKSDVMISDNQNGFTPSNLTSDDSFGFSVANLGDLDGDGVQDLAVGAIGDENNTGGENAQGSLYILFMRTNGSVKSHALIASGENGFNPTVHLDNADNFGSSVSSLGDLDGDGIQDIAVGARADENASDGEGGEGAVYILFMHANGSVKSDVKISDGENGFAPSALLGNDYFGSSVSSLGDLDGDGIIDLAVGAENDEAATDAAEGAVYILFMHANGTVKDEIKISDGLAGFTPFNLNLTNYFGRSVTNLGDLDGDGTIDLAVGAYQDDNGNGDEGALYILNLGGVYPQITLNTPLNEAIDNESVTFNWTVTDSLSDYLLCNVTANNVVVGQNVNSTNGTWTNTTVTFSTSGLKNWNVTCVNDVSGTNTSVTHELTVDANDPNVSFVSPTPANASAQTSTEFYLNVSSEDAISYHYTFVDFDNSLELWMRFDDKNATEDPTDTSGNNNNGSLIGDAHINSTSVFGEALVLDGNGDSVYIADDPRVRLGAGSFTYSVWIKPNENPDSIEQIFSKRVGGAGNYELQLEANDRVRAWIGDTGGSSTNVDSSTTVTPGNWYHVVVTRYDGTAYMYVNGVLENQTASTHNVSSTSDLYIGRDAPSATEFFNGSIDEFIIFNRSFNGSEVLALYNASVNQYFRNFTGLSFGNYTFKAYSVDRFGHLNETASRLVTLTPPPMIDFISNTPSSGTVITDTFFLTNVSVNYTYIGNISTRYYSSGVLQSANNSSSSPHYTNFSGLNPGFYEFNASLYASTDGELKNSTETRKILIAQSNKAVEGYVTSNIKIAPGLQNFSGSTLGNLDTLGTDIENIGDLDGDGVQDLAVGAYGDENAESAEGAVYILFMNTTGGVKSEVKISDGLVGFSPSGMDGSDQFGVSIANLGDLDGDGVQDLAVGANQDENESIRYASGAVYILFMHTNGSVKDNVKIASGNQSFDPSNLEGGDEFGYSVANIGDLDLDGVVDIAVGARIDENGTDEGSEGAVYILYLNTSGGVKSYVKLMNDSRGFSPSNLDIGDYFGSSVANIGDLDGDGIQDLAVGAVRDENSDSAEGAVYILFMYRNGSVKGHAKISDGLSGFSPSNLDSNDNFGTAVISLGDLDGDGIQDLLVGADADENSDTDDGAVYILFMHRNGSVKSNVKIGDGLNGFSPENLDNFDSFGFSATNLGDLDGNGVVEIAVGAYRDEASGSNHHGAFYILYLGSEQAPIDFVDPTAPHATFVTDDYFLVNLTANYSTIENISAKYFRDGVYQGGNNSTTSPHFTNFSGLGPGIYEYNGSLYSSGGGSLENQTETRQIIIAQSNVTGKGYVSSSVKIADGLVGFNQPTLNVSDEFGSAVAPIGDLNGDGIMDLAVGADRDENHVNTNANFGAFYILYMNATGGVSSSVKIADGLRGFTANKTNASDSFGHSIASMGDLDGDGVVDLAVGAYFTEGLTGGEREGSIYTLLMHANGSVKSSTWITRNAGGFNNSDLDEGDGFGSSIANIGDLDGDGIIDLAVGARFGVNVEAPDTNVAEGTLYILFMHANGSVKNNTRIGDNLGGFFPVNLSDTDNFGYSVTGMGDLDGDGVVDLAVGAPGDEVGNTTLGEGAVHILFMYQNGTVKSHTQISDGIANFSASPSLDTGDSFGRSVTNIGDFNGDSINDLAVGAYLDENGDSSEGAIYILLLNSTGGVKENLKISDGVGGFSPSGLDASDGFGSSIANIGDLNGDGMIDLAVGAEFDEYLNDSEGALYILFLDNETQDIYFINRTAYHGSVLKENYYLAEVDSPYVSIENISTRNYNVNGVLQSANNSTTVSYLTNFSSLNPGIYYVNASLYSSKDDGRLQDSTETRQVVIAQQNITTNGYISSDVKITYQEGGFTDSSLDSGDSFGSSIANIGDLNGDGVIDLAVGAESDEVSGMDDDGALYILYMNQNGSVNSSLKIANNTLGFTPSGFDGTDYFGSSVENIGDLNGDGVVDLAVGARQDENTDFSEGALYILFMNSTGGVDSHVKIADGLQGFNQGNISASDYFGSSVATLGDLDGDGIQDLVVGAYNDDTPLTPNTGTGAIYILYMQSNGSVNRSERIADQHNGFAPSLVSNDNFGWAVENVGDVDGDGIIDLAASAPGDDTGGSGSGAVYILFLNQNGSVKSYLELAEGQNGLASGIFDNNDHFGSSIANLGDLDGDSIAEIAVGARQDETSGFNDEGAFYVLYLNSTGGAKKYIKFGGSERGFSYGSELDNADYFGSSLENLGDLDGDGDIEIAVGASRDEDLSSESGSIFVLFMSSTPPADQPTTVYINSSDGSNTTSQNLHCNATLIHAYEDSLDVSVRWYLNGTLNRTIDYNNSYANETSFSATLLSGNTTRSDVWMCSIRIYDGATFNNWTNSTNLTILNSAPSLNALSPVSIEITNRTVEHNWTCSDADGEVCTIEFKINESYHSGGYSCSDDFENLSMVNATKLIKEAKCLKDIGYGYNWSIRATDGMNYSSWTQSEYNVTGVVSITFVTDLVEFGSVDVFGAPNDTTNGNPAPFLIENSGNSLINISHNSTQLWDSQSTNSTYYRIKSDNYSVELNSFNSATSIIDWLNVSLTSMVFLTDQLNYSDTNDSVEYDIYVQTPSGEGFGSKNATLKLEATFAEYGN